MILTHHSAGARGIHSINSGFNRWSIAIRNGGRRRPQPTEAPTATPGAALPQVNPQTIRALAAALVQLADELNGSA